MEETQQEEDAMLVNLREQRRSLKEGLQRSQQLTLSMLSMLASFNQRLCTSLPPSSLQGEEHERLISTLLAESSSNVHMKEIENDDVLLYTQKTKQAHENIDKTLKATRVILGHYEICRQVETTIADDPAADLKNYIGKVDRLLEAINFFKSNCWLKDRDETLHQAENLLIKSMEKLENLFRDTLTENSIIIDPVQLLKLLPNMSSLARFAKAKDLDSDSSARIGSKPDKEQLNPKIVVPNLLSPGSFFLLHEIARLMISSGHGQKCLNVYREIRYSILEHMLQKIGFEKLKTDVARKELPNVTVTDWPKHLRVSIQLLFAGEKKACDQVFDQLDPHKNQCFVNVVENIMGSILNFAETAINSKRHCESFFPMLDMFNTMHNILCEVNTMFQTNEGARLRQRYAETLHKLARTILDTLYKFEQTICKDGPFKTSTQDGMVHPLTSHVMNFVKLLSDYQSILQNLFSTQEEEADSLVILTNITGQILATLLSKLEKKSRLYKDPALAQIFLMNNVQFIIRAVQRSNAQSLLGEEWLQRHQCMVQLHATGYLHAAWDKVLQALSMQGLLDGTREMHGNGVARAILKERFRLFNQHVEELHHCQVQWTVHDSQLKKAMQKAVVESIVPTYGLFLKRFGANFEDTKNPKKYIKYTVQDLEHLLADFFEGKVVP